MSIDNNKDQEQDFIISEDIAQKIAQAMQPFLQMQEQVAEAMKPLAEFGRSMQDALKPLLRQQQRFAEFGERLRKLKKGLRESMIESGWWLTPSLNEVPIGWLSQAVNDYQNGDRIAITNLFRKVYQRENCRGLKDAVNNWRENELFLLWQRHIADALDSHINGKYTLSIPVILLVAEGIATDFCKKVGIYEEKKDRSRGGKKIKKAVQKHYEDKFNSFSPLALDSLKNVINVTALGLLEEAINTTIYQDTDRIKEKLQTNILNRHAVMHGLKKNYGTVEASLRAFMLLDVLSLIE